MTARGVHEQALSELRAIRQSLAHGRTDSALFWTKQMEKTLEAYQALYTNLKRRKSA